MSDLTSSPDKPIVAAEDVSRTFTLGRQEVEVLRHVSIEIGAGAFVALRGASGAGKSTLLHLMGGLDVPTSGKIFCRGQDLSSLSPRELARFRNRRVGFVFQAYHLFPELDALENVSLPARLARVPAAEAQRKGRELLERVGLGNRIDHRPNELSGGEQQRVAIARALINDPELLLADEPTGNLDSHSGEAIIELLMALHDECSTTLLIATHDDKVAARAPSLVELLDGQVWHSQ